MRRRKLILLFLLFLVLSGCGKKTQEVYHVGIFGIIAFTEMAEGFKAKMAELGYRDGENISYDIQMVDTVERLEEHPALKKFAAEGVDLIFAFPTEPAEAAKLVAKGKIPVVFAYAGLEDNDLVESIASPGDNITGVRFRGPASTAKRLEILYELVPDADSVGIFHDSNYPNAAPSLEAIHAAAADIGIALLEVPVTDVNSLKAALEARGDLPDIGIDAILSPGRCRPASK